MPLLITPAFMLIGIWAAALFGAGAHAALANPKPSDDQAIIYRIGVDYRTGETLSTCRENPPAVESEPR